jgi:hypothetical protein
VIFIWHADTSLASGASNATGASNASGASHVLSFPKANSLGKLYYLDHAFKAPLLPDSAVMRKVSMAYVGQAQGRVTVTGNGQLYLVGSYYLGEHPEELKSLPADMFACISFSKLGITQSLDNVIEPVSHMTGLRRLELPFSEIPENTLSKLKTLTKLESLDLTACSLRGSCLHDLSGLPKLQVLYLQGNRLDTSAYMALSHCKTLAVLNLSQTGITDQGLGEIVKLPNLRELTLANARITLHGLKQLTALKHLTYLELTDTKLQAKDLLCLAPLKLQHFLLPHGYSARDLKMLHDAMPTTKLSAVSRAVDSDTNTLCAPLRY